MRGERCSIHTKIVHAQRHFPQSLRRVGMKSDTPRVSNRGKFANGLNGTDFAVRSLNGNENGIIVQLALKRFRGDESPSVARSICNLVTISLHASGAFEDGLVLQACRYDARSLASAPLLGTLLHTGSG